MDIVDAAMGPLSGMTSQANLNTLVECLRFTERDTGMDFETLQQTAEYWEGVRRYYLPFESGQLAPSAEVYRHEMPGGQSTNLYQQAQALGLDSALARMLPHVRRGQSPVRRHHQGDADVEGGRRHGAVHGRRTT